MSARTEKRTKRGSARPPGYHRPVPSDDALPHGPHDPVTGTPPRRPGSIRRTSTIDSNRPGELHGPLTIDARARDLLTRADGTTELVAEASLTAEVPDQSTRALGSITTAPPVAGIDDVLGAMVGPGFRGKVARAAPDLAEGSLAHLLLDDLPGASLVSGYALMHAGATSFRHQREGFAAAQTDLCAGWAGDGFMMTFIRTEGRPPHVVGPLAPPLETDDTLGWHRFEPLGPPPPAGDGASTSGPTTTGHSRSMSTSATAISTAMTSRRSSTSTRSSPRSTRPRWS